MPSGRAQEILYFIKAEDFVPIIEQARVDIQLNVNTVLLLLCFIALDQNLVLKKERDFSNLQKVGMGKLNVALLTTKSENYFHQISFVKPFLGS